MMLTDKFYLSSPAQKHFWQVQGSGCSPDAFTLLSPRQSETANPCKGSYSE